MSRSPVLLLRLGRLKPLTFCTTAIRVLAALLCSYKFNVIAPLVMLVIF